MTKQQIANNDVDSSGAEHLINIFQENLLILYVNGLRLQIQKFLVCKQAAITLRIIFIEKFESCVFNRFFINKLFVSIDLFRWESPSVHVHHNLHLRHCFNVFIILYHSLCKTMHHQNFRRQVIFFYNFLLVPTRIINISCIKDANHRTRFLSALH